MAKQRNGRARTKVCPACGGAVSARALDCPGCGHPVGGGFTDFILLLLHGGWAAVMAAAFAHAVMWGGAEVFAGVAFSSFEIAAAWIAGAISLMAISAILRRR